MNGTRRETGGPVSRDSLYKKKSGSWAAALDIAKRLGLWLGFNLYGIQQFKCQHGFCGKHDFAIAG